MTRKKIPDLEPKDMGSFAIPATVHLDGHDAFIKDGVWVTLRFNVNNIIKLLPGNYKALQVGAVCDSDFWGGSGEIVLSVLTREQVKE